MFWTDSKQNITDTGPFIYDNGIRLTVRRLDLMDPIWGGNKWFKLKYNLERFQKENYEELVTFGGAFSNHIAAVARVGKALRISTTGIIRGDATSKSNTTLSRAVQDGMNLIFVSREAYRQKEDPLFVQNLLPGKRNIMILPEGGCNVEGVLGCREIISPHDNSYSHIVVACGTGTTAAGIIQSLQTGQQLIGISVLRDEQSVESTILQYLQHFVPGSIPQNWKVNHEYHFGGYAKAPPDLRSFCMNFTSRTAIPIEPVYSGKTFYAIEKMIGTGGFPSGSTILAIHTGGMQYLL